jgi:fibrillarin-like pre-rRNA processing protein
LNKRLTKKDGEYYVNDRLFDATHSKFAAALKNGMKSVLKPNDVVLYLGASHGYTVSFIAELCRFIFAVEISPYVLPRLIETCKKHKNIAPIFADASKPFSYFRRVCEADIVYQDIAQKNQVEIFLNNIELFLKKGGYGLLAVKCRSIDVVSEPEYVFKQVKSDLEKHLKIISYFTLEPFEKDHYLIVVRK